MQTLIQDIRYGIRVLLKAPGFTVVAVLTLALGIGATTAIFSVADAVLLRPLPYPHPEQIVRVWEQAADGHHMNLADPNFDDFRAQNNTLASLAEYAYWTSSVSGGSEPVRVNMAEVTSGFFKSLGVEPFRGRTFGCTGRRQSSSAMVIGSDIWAARRICPDSIWPWRGKSTPLSG